MALFFDELEIPELLIGPTEFRKMIERERLECYTMANLSNNFDSPLVQQGLEKQLAFLAKEEEKYERNLKILQDNLKYAREALMAEYRKTDDAFDRFQIISTLIQYSHLYETLEVD